MHHPSTPEPAATETSTPVPQNSKIGPLPLPSPTLHKKAKKMEFAEISIRIFLLVQKQFLTKNSSTWIFYPTKKQTKMTTRSAHQRNTILVLKFFFTKTTKTTDLYKGFDHLYKASNTSTRQQNSAM
jgi:hypothetical protein